MGDFMSQNQLELNIEDQAAHCANYCANFQNIALIVKKSLHSWGVAIDVNAAWNPMGKEPKLSQGFVKCFKDAGFDWGGDWDYPDGMHFQLKSFRK